MLAIMHHANYRRVTAHIPLPNDAAAAFHERMGFRPVREENGVLLMAREIEPENPGAERFTKPYLIENADLRARPRARRDARARGGALSAASSQQKLYILHRFSAR